MDGLQILDTLKKINPWFKTNSVPNGQLESLRRREFDDLEKTLYRTEMATLIIGGRRVGKSVLMYQLIDSLLKKGISGKKILFVQGDNPIFPEMIKEGKILSSIIEIYQKYIIEKSFDELDDTIYIFVDEAHNLKDWQLDVKTLIDLKYRIKFVVTGSSSHKLRKGSENPLTGRVSIHTISPFSFIDFLRYQFSNDQRANFDKTFLKISDKFKDSFFSGNLNESYQYAEEANKLLDRSYVCKKLNDYLYWGGFPWIVSHPKDEDRPKYLRDLLTTTISKEILTQVDARETQAFERLMVNISLSAGTVASFKNFATTLGIDERTVSKYVDYYVEAHWAFISSPYTFHRRLDSVKDKKKLYVIDTGIINVLCFKDEGEFQSDKQYKGRILENSIHNHLLCFEQKRFGAFQSSMPFWIDESLKEIDFILEIKGGNIPIEVKCKVSPDRDDLVAIQEFLKTKASAKLGVITTEEILKIDEKILYIPYYLFLALL